MGRTVRTTIPETLCLVLHLQKPHQPLSPYPLFQNINSPCLSAFRPVVLNQG